jgi:hypothetical protein
METYRGFGAVIYPDILHVGVNGVTGSVRQGAAMEEGAEFVRG